MSPWQHIDNLRDQQAATLAHLKGKVRELGGSAPCQLVPSGVWRCSYRPPGFARTLHVRGNTPDALLAALQATVQAYRKGRA